MLLHLARPAIPTAFIRSSTSIFFGRTCHHSHIKVAITDIFVHFCLLFCGIFGKQLFRMLKLKTKKGLACRTFIIPCVPLDHAFPPCLYSTTEEVIYEEGEKNISKRWCCAAFFFLFSHAEGFFRKYSRPLKMTKIYIFAYKCERIFSIQIIFRGGGVLFHKQPAWESLKYVVYFHIQYKCVFMPHGQTFTNMQIFLLVLRSGSAFVLHFSCRLISAHVECSNQTIFLSPF